MIIIKEKVIVMAPAAAIHHSVQQAILPAVQVVILQVIPPEVTDV